MDLRFADDALNTTPELRYAIQLYQVGFLESAHRHFQTALASSRSAVTSRLMLLGMCR